jgi:hypothetical protein
MLVILVCCGQQSNQDSMLNEYGLPYAPYSFAPQEYEVQQFQVPPVVDGKVQKDEWKGISWSTYFVSEVNGKSEDGRFATRFKMGVAEDTVYVLVRLNDDQVWANHANYYSSYFQDNSITLYIDWDNDEYDYFTIKVNAMGLVSTGYGNVLHKKKYYPAQDLGIHCGVFIDGTLNDPSDKDQYWQVEMAIPINIQFNDTVLLQPNHCWKLNLVRSQWQYSLVNGMYKKVLNAEDGRKYPGECWVWNNTWGNPISKVELWGEVFGSDPELISKEEWSIKRRIKWELRNVFYAQQLHYQKYGKYANKIGRLKDVGLDLSALHYKPDIQSNNNQFIAIIKDEKYSNSWSVDELGRVDDEIQQ